MSRLVIALFALSLVRCFEEVPKDCRAEPQDDGTTAILCGPIPEPAAPTNEFTEPETTVIINGPNAVSGTIVSRTVDEAAGMTCTDGGTRVEMGLDDDNSGTLSDEEVDTSTLICRDACPRGYGRNAGGICVINSACTLATDCPVSHQCSNGVCVQACQIGFAVKNGTCEPASVTGLGAGGTNTCLLKSDFSLACYGGNTSGQISGLALTRDFTKSGAGSNHICALRTSGAITCAGGNGDGQATPPTALGHTDLGVGTNNACAVTATQTLACWGSNTSGQATPPTGTFKKVACGEEFCCAVDSADQVQCWGSDTETQVTGKPAAGTPNVNGYVGVAAGARHACAFKLNGTLSCWGDDANGQATVPGGVSASAVALSKQNTCALKSDKTLQCWGGGAANAAPTTPPVGLFASLACGADHCCAVRDDGAVLCWGSDMSGQISALP